MAGDSAYPYIGEKNWWILRKQFQKSMPQTVSISYIKSLLGVGSESAARNIIRSLQQLGLVDAEGRPTELANRWRLDPSYADACKEIVEAVYPDELRSLFNTPDSDRERIADWMMSNKKVGKTTARQTSAMYSLLLQKDFRPAVDSSKVQKPKSPSKTKSKNRKVTVKSDQETYEHQEPDGPIRQTLPGVSVSSKTTPVDLHIDLQIHISPEATAEQIDQIFRSIASHLHISEN